MKGLGARGTVEKLMDTNIVRVGRLMGRDEMGNTYYEALPGHGPAERKRWVEPSHYYFDASEVSPQWHRWLHYQSDEVPSQEELDYVYRIPHRPNLTGTQQAYRPSGYLFQKNVKSFQNYQKVEDALTPERLNAELAKKD